jgi:uncharacterized protein (TIGR03435 family)
MMKRVLTAVFVLFAATGLAFAQAGDARPAFDVATIKPAGPDENTSNRATADQMISTHQTLKQLVVLAYGVQPLQVIAPDWMESVRFDVTGKYPPGTKDRDRWLMLRTLLEDRFRLAVHHETKEMQGYALIVAKGGFKLKPSEPGERVTVGGNQGRVWTFRARKIPLSDLAYELGDSLGGIVVDETGLVGVYDFQLRWASDEMTNSGDSDPNPAPSLFTALQDTLGLSLQKKKVPVDMIVVDHVERTPTEN